MTRTTIAETFLRLLAEDEDPSPGTERYYVQTAASHGVTLTRIAELSRIPLTRVVTLAKEQ